MKSSLTLFEIASEYRAMELRLRELDCDEQTIADTLEAESGDLTDKLCAVVAVAESMEVEAAAVKAHVIDRAQKRVSALMRRAEGLKRYALETMVACNRIDIQQPDMRFRVRENPVSVVIDDETKVPEAYFFIKEVKSIDKAAIKEALSIGAVPGAHTERKKRLEIL